MIKENLKAIHREIGDAKLIVVSKFRTIDELKEVYDSEERDFAENRVQELLKKVELLPDDIRWHMIGHLQTKKVKQIAPFIHLIHSVDSIRLCKEIDKQAAKNNRIIRVLLQVHIAEEEQKFGFDSNELLDMLQSTSEFDEFEHLEICGLMGMATFTNNETQILEEFSSIKTLLEKIKKLKPRWKSFKELSIGMSNDCHLAVKCGSTMVRVGTRIFK